MNIRKRAIAGLAVISTLALSFAYVNHAKGEEIGVVAGTETTAFLCSSVAKVNENIANFDIILGEPSDTPDDRTLYPGFHPDTRSIVLVEVVGFVACLYVFNDSTKQPLRKQGQSS